MSLWAIILLGALQGLTEMLPISSSAHLVAAQALLGAQAPGVGVEVALHLGTLIAIVAIMWKDLWALAADGLGGIVVLAKGGQWLDAAARRPLFPTAVAVAVGTVPAAVTGVFLEDRIERTFESLLFPGLFLMITAALLALTRTAPKPAHDRVGPGQGFVVGVAQAFALLPGISRSGATIAAGCFLGLERKAAARFSFLLAVPALAGAAAWELRGGLSGWGVPVRHVALGMAVSALVGAVCLKRLLRIVERGKLHWFAAYCLPAGAAMAVAGLWASGRAV